MNPIQEILKLLWGLQKLDDQIFTLSRAEDPSAESKLQETELKRLKHREQEKRLMLEECRSVRNQILSELEDCRQRITRANTAVRSGRNTAAIQRILPEVETLKILEQNLELKERAIERSIETERAYLIATQEERRLLESKMASFSTSSNENHKQGNLHKIQEIEKLKAQVAAQLPATFVLLYRRLIETRNGVAIAAVSKNSCGGCHRVLPFQVIQVLSHAQNLEHCMYCKRILILSTHQ